MISNIYQPVHIRQRREIVSIICIACLFLFLFITVLFVSTSTANAQSNCGERTSIVGVLDDRYHEKPVALGMTQGGGVVEVFASTNGSWTMIVSMPTGHACFLASGDDWENLPKLVRGTKI